MKHLFTAVVVLFSIQAYAAGWEENTKIGELFKSADVKGTFVLYDVTTRRLTGHDRLRAKTRYVPASTFKIPNTLIGLSVGAVKNVDEILPFGGKPQPFKAWEKDMSLREAIVISNAAIYQELARRIGLDRMRDVVSKLNYGNKNIGSVVDEFWLLGPLEISAIEQTEFLAKLAQNGLSFQKDIQESARDLIRLEQGDDWTLYGKTGWENAPNPGVGWWVGWVQKKGRIYAFALNIDIQKASDASKRVELGKASLKTLGIL
jgi:beta-lactamase class D